MTTREALPPGLAEIVGQWARGRGYRFVAEVLSMSMYHTEWAGSTEGGFYSKYGVTVEIRDNEGCVWPWVVDEEEDLIDLWFRVVGAWPDESVP